MIDYKNIKCPKCGKQYFKDHAEGGSGTFFDFLSGNFFSDAVYRRPPEKIYKNGELQNPEAFVPKPTIKYFTCLECNCNFSVKTTYHLDGSESYEFIDDDKLRKESEESWNRQKEELNKKSQAKTLIQNLDSRLTVNSINTAAADKTSLCIDNSIIDRLGAIEERLKRLEEK